MNAIIKTKAGYSMILKSDFSLPWGGWESYKGSQLSKQKLLLRTNMIDKTVFIFFFNSCSLVHNLRALSVLHISTMTNNTRKIIHWRIIHYTYMILKDKKNHISRQKEQDFITESENKHGWHNNQYPPKEHSVEYFLNPNFIIRVPFKFTMFIQPSKLTNRADDILVPLMSTTNHNLKLISLRCQPKYIYLVPSHTVITRAFRWTKLQPYIGSL